MIEIICKNCQKLILTYPSNINRKKYCSKKCAYDGKRVENLTKEQREKLSKARKGIPAWNRGKKLSEEHRKKLSISHIGKATWNRGKNISENHRKKLIISHLGKFRANESPHWRGGKYKNPDGYVFIYRRNHPFANGGKYVFEHRLIIEKILNRFLYPSERIHHINEIRDDNRVKNLICFSSQSAHQRFHKNPFSVKEEEIIFDGRFYS